MEAAAGIAKLLQLNGSFENQLGENNGKGNENVRFVKKIWKIIGPVLCGPNKEEYEKDPCPDAMYSHQSNSRALEVMLYLMTNNPLIVYSPNGTEVDEVVKRVGVLLSFVASRLLLRTTVRNIKGLFLTWLGFLCSFRGIYSIAPGKTID